MTSLARPSRRLVSRYAFEGKVDVPLLLSTAVLLGIGALSVYAATSNRLVASGLPGTRYLQRDLINIAVAVVLVAPLARKDYRLLRPWAPLLYAANAFLLLVVLTPLGSSVNGAHGWFTLGVVQLEPSEFMKLSLLVLLAALLAERVDIESGPSRSVILWAMVATGVPMLLVLAEPALGIAIVLGVLSLVVLALSGAPGRLIGVLLVGVVLAGWVAFSAHLLKPYQEQRFTYLANPHGAHTSTGYQIRQSEIAIGNGGLTGRGFLGGSQTDGGFIPEQQTDFVFTVSAEEGGLVAGTVLITALGVLLWRALLIADRARDLFGRLLAVGIAGWFGFQAFVNIGMTLGIMPVTGLPLPFVSYGGSSDLADLAAVALLVSIGCRGVAPG